ncbi:uncharacterized protein [Ptychodera flava]|uniref:uncharacterized protein n=1 Tax=Ptychodera flava TaxID=63121 RepID=UPI00396A2F9D
MNEGFHLFVVHGLVLVLQGFNVADGLGIVAKSEDTAYTGSDKMLYCDYREGPPSEAISTVAVDWDKADSSQDYGWQNLCKGGTGIGISKFSRDPQKFFINPDGTDQSLTIRQITKEDAGIYRCMVVITTTVDQENQRERYNQFTSS